MEEKLKEKTKESIEKILDEGLTTANLEHLYKLVKINHIAKEDENMYRDYGRERYNNYGEEYGRENYNARGRRYRGDDSLGRMGENYGRYQESRRYGDEEGTDMSFHYMVKALEDFIKVLHEEAETPKQKQELMQALQNSMR